MFNSLEDLIDAIGRRDELPDPVRRELDEVLMRALLDYNDRKATIQMTAAMRELTLEMKRHATERRRAERRGR